MNWFSFSYNGWNYCTWAHTHDFSGVMQDGSHTPANRFTCSLNLYGPSLILNMPVIINWHLSKQGIHWPVSHDHIVGLRLVFIKVTCFFGWPLTKCWFLIGLQVANVFHYFWCILRLLKLKTEGQTMYRKLHHKATKLKSKSLLILS